MRAGPGAARAGSLAKLCAHPAPQLLDAAEAGPGPGYWLRARAMSVKDSPGTAGCSPEPPIG